LGLPAVAGRLSLLRFVRNFVAGLIAYTLPHAPRVKSALWLPTILAPASIYVIFPVAPMRWAVCLMLGLAIPFFSEIRTPWLRWLSNRIATYSYGIYLSHQFRIWLVFDPLRSWPLWAGMICLISLLVGVPIALYRAIEKPIIKTGIRLADKCIPQPVAAAAAA
jgi:peptidoglycan/LPS O-acetylase OafA/YrhL